MKLQNQVNNINNNNNNDNIYIALIKSSKRFTSDYKFQQLAVLVKKVDSNCSIRCKDTMSG